MKEWKSKNKTRHIIIICASLLIIIRSFFFSTAYFPSNITILSVIFVINVLNLKMTKRVKSYNSSKEQMNSLRGMEISNGVSIAFIVISIIMAFLQNETEMIGAIVISIGENFYALGDLRKNETE